MKVLLTMANNSSTPYFTRFADLERNTSDFELIFLCLYPTMPDMMEEMNEKGFKCYWIKYDRQHRKTQLLLAFFRSFILLRRIKPDVVHTHLFEDSLPILLASWLLGIKKRIISKLDAGYHFIYAKKWFVFDKLNNWLSSHIIAVSEENRDFILDKERAKQSKVHLIYQGLPENELIGGDDNIKSRLVSELNLEDKKVVLCVARYIPWKGQEKIILAAKILESDFPNLKFLFFGAGEDQMRLQELVDKEGLNEMVHLGGWISRRDLNNLYELCDVYCNASSNEPFGFVIAEALLKKLPLVTTPTGAASCLLDDKVHAVIADYSPESIAEGIAFVLSGDSKNMVEKGYKLAQQHFIVERMWDDHKKLYLDL